MQQRNVLQYLEATVKEVPDKVAYEDADGRAMTFSEVYDASRSIGSCLAHKGYSHEPVIIFMEKTPQCVATFFGTVYAGCFYVPIDEEMPAMRTELIIKTLDPRVMICDAKTREKAGELAFNGEILVYEEIFGLGEDTAALDLIRSEQIDTDPIYIVFTSGSTGVPKGVAACHRSVIDYIENLSAVLKFDRDTRFGNQSPFYFDACLKELYPTIKFGASTVIVPRQLFMFPLKLVEFLNEKKINTICWVVSALTMISSLGALKKETPKYLRTIAFGSEVFPVKQFNRWREACPDTRFVNLYGPTEATGMSCYFEVDRDFEEGEAIPIGRPFDNTRILLLDDEDKLAEEGEICIAGTAVTLGYFNNPELVFVSRKDYQIKHMGHRIELGEIEANVATDEQISLCCAVYVKEKDRIHLFYTGDKDEQVLGEDLKEHLPR